MFQYAANRRNFFESVAKEGGFDPLVPDNWYSLPRSKLLAVPVCFYSLFIFKNLSFVLIIVQGARSVLVYYRFNIAKALRELFPGIEIDEAKFKCMFRKYSLINIILILICSLLEGQQQQKAVF